MAKHDAVLLLVISAKAEQYNGRRTSSPDRFSFIVPTANVINLLVQYAASHLIFQAEGSPCQLGT